MGELRQRGTIWWIRYYRNGKRYEQSSGSTKKGDAERLLRLKEGAIAKGIPITPAVDRIRFDELVTDLLNDYRNNGKRSADNVEAMIETHLKPWFVGARMVNVTTADVRAYIAHRREQDAANSTINRELSALKRMFRLAVQAGKLLSAPHIPMLEERNTRTGFFEREQFESVRAHLPKDLYGLVTFAYHTGWRVDSEVSTLQWHQVDRKAGTVRLEPGTTKNREARTVYYAQITELQDTITAQWALHEAFKKKGTIVPWVFPRTIGRTKGQKTGSFRKAWLTACEAAGCPGRVPHDFRRTAIRNMVRAGVPERVAMTLSGHRTRSVFDRYNIVADSDLREAATRLQTFAESGQGQKRDNQARSGA